MYGLAGMLKVPQVLLMRNFKSWTIFPLPFRNFIISVILQVSSVCSRNICRTWGMFWAENSHHPWLDHDLSVGNDLVKVWKMPPAVLPHTGAVFWPAVLFQLTGECWGEPGHKSQWVWVALQEDVCAFCCRRNEQWAEKINCILECYSSKLDYLIFFFQQTHLSIT